MSRRAWKWAAITVGSLLVVCAALLWLVATDSGTRWIMARVSPLLPGQLELAGVDGSLVKGINLRSITWQDDQSQASVEHLYLHVELWPLPLRRVRVLQLDVSGVDIVAITQPSNDAPASSLNVNLPVDLLVDTATLVDARVSVNDQSLDISRLELAGRLDGPELSVRNFSVRSSLGDVDLTADAQLAGRYAAAATVAWTLRLPEQPPLSGNLTLRGDSSDYRIVHKLSTPYVVSTKGSLSLDEGSVAFDVDNRWDDPVLITAGDQQITADTGSLRVFGRPNEFSFGARTLIELAGYPQLAVNLTGTRKDDVIELQSLSAASDRGSVQASGRFLLAPELSWTAAVNLIDVDPGLFGPRFSGRLNVVANTSGSISNGAPTATVSIDDISGNLNDFPVTGAVDLSYADALLKAENATLSIGDNRADFTASFGKQLLLDASLNLSKLGQLGLDAAGNLGGDIRLVTTDGSLQLTGAVSGRNLRWQDYSAKVLDTQFDVPVTGRGRIDARIANAAVAGIDIVDGSFSVTGTLDKHALRADLRSIGGRAEIEADGGFADSRWSGLMSGISISGETLGQWRLREPANITVSPPEVRIEKACLSSTSSSGFACAEFSNDGLGELRFDLSLRELPVTALPLRLPPGVSVAGMIEGQSSGRMTGNLLTTDAAIAIRDFGLSAVVDEETIAIELERASASASVVDNNLTGELDLTLVNQTDYLTGTAEIANVFDPLSAVNGSARLELNDMSVFSILFPDVADPAGRIAGKIDISGSLDAAKFAGELGLTDGSLGIRRAGISLEDIELQLQQSRAGELALQGSARSGDGRLDIDSKTTLSSSSGIRSDVRIEGENFTLLRLPEWRLDASPSIDIVFDDRAARVSGELVIPNADISIHDVPESAERPSGDVVVHRGSKQAPSPRRTVVVDVRTVLGSDVNFTGFGLQTGLEGAVRIRGSSDTTYLSTGRVTLREGRYAAYGQKLDIESGELIFNGALTNPSLNVRAIRTASDGTVAGIRLSGTPMQLRSEVYSEPPLADAEALSYLLTGRPLGSADAADGNMLNQAAFALGLSTAGNVASRVRNDLGLETLGIQGGGEDSQLVAGKRIGDRLLIEYAYGIVDNLGELLLRYQLSNRLIIESRSGSSRSVDLVYSVKKP